MSIKEFIVDSPDIEQICCCDCSLVHSFFFEVVGKDKIRVVVQRNNVGTEHMRKRSKIKIYKRGKEIDSCGLKKET